MKKHRIAVDDAPETRLETYMREWGVMSSAFARRSGISRPHLLRLRKGDAEPSRRVMVALTETASLMRESPVYMVELFELAPSDETVYLALPGEKESAVTPLPELRIVGKVTRKHGETFADWWGNASDRSGALTEACSEAHLMTWPEGNPMEQNRFHAIQNRIARRILDELRETIVRKFVKVANEELSRAREQ